MLMENYKFIIVGNNSGEYYDFSYKQLDTMDYAYFDNHFPEREILKILYKIHTSSKINRFLEIPGKSAWINSRLTKYENIINTMHPKKAKICFLLFSSCIPLEKYGFSVRLKNKFPKAKIVYFFQDLVYRDKNKAQLLENLPESVDLIYSFDYTDAEKYNLRFHNLPYSCFENILCDIKPRYEIAFLGAAKNRLDKIYKAYEAIQAQGIKNIFYITGVPLEHQIYKEIHYCDSFSYEFYLDILKNSKCFLEVLQKEGSGNTLRVNEVIAYDKLLISDNKKLVDNPLYDERNMMIYDDLSKENIKRFIEQYPIFYEAEYKRKMSPKTFLEDIKRDLENMNT